MIRISFGDASGANFVSSHDEARKIMSDYETEVEEVAILTTDPDTMSTITTWKSIIGLYPLKKEILLGMGMRSGLGLSFKNEDDEVLVKLSLRAAI